MINNILISILLMLPSIIVEGNDIKFRVNESSRFEGSSVVCEEDTMYRGTIFNKNMKIQKGFYKANFEPVHYKEYYGVLQEYNGVVFYDQFFIKNGWCWNHATYEKNGKDLYYKNHIAHNISNGVFIKNYSPIEKEWTIFEIMAGPDGIYNEHNCTTYNHDGSFSNGKKTRTDKFFNTFCLFIIILCGMIMLLWPFHKLWPGIITTKIVISFSVVSSIIIFCVFSNYERIQIVNFIVIFLIIFGLTLLIENFRIKNSVRILFCSLSCSLMVLYCFIKTSEKVELDNHQSILVSWAPGTDFIKRIYLKNMLKNFVPVPIVDNEVQYTLYLNKYEFSEVDFSMVTDEMFNWVDLLFTKKPLGDFSYRECRILIDKINTITGLTLDMPTVNEWECATAGHKYVLPLKINGVKKGVVNRFGLVNIASNAAEYASNYYSDALRLSLDADTLIRAYDFVAICRGDSIGNHCVNYVEKNSNEAFVTFRLAYRPQHIGKRNFKIVGFLRSDCQNDTLPQQIRLLAINNLPVDKMSDYETFQEVMIENRFVPKTCQMINIATNKQETYSFPKGIECYNYIPLFSFEGLQK